MPVGIRVIATVNGVPRGPILGGKSKSTGEIVISGGQFRVLGIPQDGAQMLQIGESLSTRGKGLLAGIRVNAIIIVVPSSLISRDNLRFAVGIAIFRCQFRPILGILELLARMSQDARAVGRRAKCLVEEGPRLRCAWRRISRGVQR